LSGLALLSPESKCWVGLYGKYAAGKKTGEKNDAQGAHTDGVHLGNYFRKIARTLDEPANRPRDYQRGFLQLEDRARYEVHL
jgi:hypothetical protein